MELYASLSLFLTWNIESIKSDAIPQFFYHYAQHESGKYFHDIAYLLSQHDHLMSLRRSEHIEDDTFSVINHSEAENIVKE